MKVTDILICENCGKIHDGSYGSGRFCSKFCAHSYTAKQGMESKNRKRSDKLKNKHLSVETRFKIAENNRIRFQDPQNRLMVSNKLKAYYTNHQHSKDSLVGESYELSEYSKLHSIDHSNDVPPDGYLAFGKYLIQRCLGHPKAYNMGEYVYAHILAAEQKLGRPLNDGETVHHIDFDGWNNNPDNLMIFLSNSDHIRYHHMLIHPDRYKLICSNQVWKTIRIDNF